MRMLSLFHYLFRPPRLKQRLPLLPSSGSSMECRSGVDVSRRKDLELMLLSGVAKTEADAQRLLNRYPDLRVASVIDIARRERRHKNIWSLAMHRFFRLW